MNVILIWTRRDCHSRWINSPSSAWREWLYTVSSQTARSRLWWGRVVSSGRQAWGWKDVTDSSMKRSEWEAWVSSPVNLPTHFTWFSKEPRPPSKKIYKLGTLIHCKTWQIITPSAGTMTYLSGASDCHSPLYTNMCVPQNRWEDSWSLWEALAGYFIDVQEIGSVDPQVCLAFSKDFCNRWCITWWELYRWSLWDQGDASLHGTNWKVMRNK